MTLLGGAVPFVGEIVGRSRERVERGDVRAHPTRQQERRHRKILVVRATVASARSVGSLQIYHSVSTTPARRFAARAMTNSRSESRFRYTITIGSTASATKAHDAPLRAAADRSAHVQQRTRQRPARQDEPAQRLELGLEAIDRLLQALDVGLLHRRLGDTTGDALRRVGQSRADGKKFLLNRLERSGQIGIEPGRSRGAERRVQFVDLAVHVDPGIRLRHARFVEERRLAGVAGLCVDLHDRGLPLRDSPESTRRHTRAIHYMGSMAAPSLPTPPARQRFRRRLLTWYRANGRDLPWRRTSDPYHILVSEVMLQQTQVDRVLPKYHEWLDRYPSLDGAGHCRRT